MNPKEKAEHLIKRYMPYSYFSCDCTASCDMEQYQTDEAYENAKKSALVTVYIIIEILEPLIWKQNFYEILDSQDYWKEVKNELTIAKPVI